MIVMYGPYCARIVGEIQTDRLHHSPDHHMEE